MVKIQRYGIYWVNLDPVIGSEMKKCRPAVVISQDSMNRYASTVVVCPITSSLHPLWRSRIQICCDGREAEIAIDQIRTVSKQRIGAKLDSVSESAATQIRDLISEMYGMGQSHRAPD